MGRRGGDVELGWGGEEVWCGVKRQWWQWDRWSHIHVWQIEIRRDTLGANVTSSRPDHTVQGSSAGKIKL